MIKSETFKESKVKIYLPAVLSAVVMYILFYIFLISAKFGFAVGFGLYCAVLRYYKKPFTVILCFNAAAFCCEQTLYAVYAALLPSFIFLILLIILKKSKGGLLLWKMCLAVMLSRLTLFLNGGGNEEKALLAIELFVSVLFMMISVNAVKAPLFRGIKRLSADETVCIAVLALAFYAGLYQLSFFGFKIYLLVASLSLLASLYVYSLSFTLSYSLIIGMAVCLLSGNAAYLGVYAVYALTAYIFKDTSKYLSAVSIVLVDLLFAYYFKVFDAYSYYELFALSAGCFFFLFIPKRFLEKISAELGDKSEKQLSRHIINRTRGELNAKLISVSEVFYEMEKAFNGMIKGYMSVEDAVEMLSQDAVGEVCGACPDKSKCHKSNLSAITAGYKAAIASGIEKGKVTLLDIPPQLAGLCIKTNAVLSVCNRLSNSYRQYAIVISNLDTSRALIGRQFRGVGDILTRLSKDTKNSLSFDFRTERLIIDELAYNNIVCLEAVVYNENNSCKNVSLLVKTADSFDKSISTILSRLMGTKMLIAKREEGRTANLCAMHLKPAPQYDVVFGAAGCAKEGKEISGDTHTLTRISEERFLLALCDGMGSGEAAEKTSSMAISMVENFYRAGFDSETVLSGVNRLLNVGGEDNFAALDICAIDLNRGVCDFIKLGAPEGYVKRKNNTETVASSALPVGILDELSPVVTIKNVSVGDTIVLVSDGISGAFSEKESLKEFIFSENTVNPQQLAESILKRALFLNQNVATDDMTVLTMRIYARL